MNENDEFTEEEFTKELQKYIKVRDSDYQLRHSELAANEPSNNSSLLSSFLKPAPPQPKPASVNSIQSKDSADDDLLNDALDDLEMDSEIKAADSFLKSAAGSNPLWSDLYSLLQQRLGRGEAAVILLSVLQLHREHIHAVVHSPMPEKTLQQLQMLLEKTQNPSSQQLTKP